MKIHKLSEIPVKETPHKVDARELYNNVTAQAIHISLKPNESLKPHITPVDVFFYILEGEVDVRVGDETITVEKDSLVESPKDIVHCLTNSSKSIARILVVKAPKPTTKAKFF